VNRVSGVILDEVEDDDDAIDEMVCEGIEYELAGAIVRLDRSLVGKETVTA
jgi:hypothetical protein